MTNIIRSSKHYLNHSNTNKISILKEFLNEYKLATQFAVDYIWSFQSNEFNLSLDKLN